MVKANIVATGSSGNFAVIENVIAIDAGVSYVKVQPYLDKLKLVLLTHAHSDHFVVSTVRKMALEKPRLKFACGPFMVHKLKDASVPERNIVILRPNLLYEFGICNVIPFELEHDVKNYGYKIHFPWGKLFWATDMASLGGISAKGYDLYCVEANYEKDEIRARMDAKMEAGLYAYETRVLKYHMAREDCDNWLVRNVGPNSEYIYLHCHEEVKNERNQEREHSVDGAGGD